MHGRFGNPRDLRTSPLLMVGKGLIATTSIEHRSQIIRGSTLVKSVSNMSTISTNAENSRVFGIQSKKFHLPVYEDRTQN